MSLALPFNLSRKFYAGVGSWLISHNAQHNRPGNTCKAKRSCCFPVRVDAVVVCGTSTIDLALSWQYD